MSENRVMLVDTAEAVFTEAATKGFAPIAEAGFASLLISEDKGGFGGDWGDLFAVLRVAGAQALTLPVGETIVAAKLLSDAGKLIPEGPLALDDKPSQGKEWGAFIRVALSAGALDAALAMSIDHANTRVQFGKQLAKFQAVQQSLAAFANEAASVNVAGAAAAAALDAGEALFEIAAAKLRTNMAIGIGTAIAHQVHGAIGYTQEYGLHPLTSSLMRWRSDYGNDSYWAGVLGDLACAHGGAGLWAEMTRRGDGVAVR
jgi:alkylation response protein AidB-like acyl-CoA dehydrogenase